MTIQQIKIRFLRNALVAFWKKEIKLREELAFPLRVVIDASPVDPHDALRWKFRTPAVDVILN